MEKLGTQSAVVPVRRGQAADITITLAPGGGGGDGGRWGGSPGTGPAHEACPAAR